ncbi:hypothetical protein J437_LFUL016066 [Ladona fulva]|uniref:Uncharacterized protein n=1 Tax=Ladona fulva TaxID=123851 RepID=A0A8K0P735_LADFU|nr:hypothetical protein J437_LFUL016066 [Ladona fulva]
MGPLIQMLHSSHPYIDTGRHHVHICQFWMLLSIFIKEHSPLSSNTFKFDILSNINCTYLLFSYKISELKLFTIKVFIWNFV